MKINGAEHAPLKVVCCWSTISGYMAACWKRLAALPEVDLLVLAHESKGNSSFGKQIMEGVPCTLLSPTQAKDAELIAGHVTAFNPQIVMVTGWWLKAYRDLVLGLPADTKVVMGIDTPWRNPLQLINRLRYRRYLGRLDHVMVTGERSWQHARHLGFDETMISRGMYGVDFSRFSKIAGERALRPWPRRFVFMGRYVDIKGIDVLAAAYAAYREQVEDPWELVCCGMGPLKSQLAGQSGVVDQGFVQPAALRDMLFDAGALVLPSRFDPWPLALVEGAAAGLPIICTNACGSAVEIVRQYYNGLVVSTGCAASLTSALVEMHARYDELPTWGERSVELAAPYAAEHWAERQLQCFRQLVSS
ncbi:glycosyltransferase family 4 protein [Planctomycetaceae bacterium SH139]